MRDQLENLEDFDQEMKKIDLYVANGVGLLILGIAGALFGIPFFLIHKTGIAFTLQIGLMCFVLMLVGIVVHELIHGFFFGLFAKSGFKSIRFGVIWKMITPYCHCKEPLKVKHYLIGALMPALLLGIVPAVISLFNGSGLLLILGIFFTAAAAGDFMMSWMLRKEHPETFVQDHPSEAGFYVYRKK